MKRKILGSLLLMVVTVGLTDSKRASSAPQRQLIAVFPIESSGVALDSATRQRLTSYLSAKLARRSYRVVAETSLRAQLRQQKKQSYRQCYDAACQIAIGRELAAQKALSAKVLRLGERCVVALTVFDLKTASTERAADAKADCAVGAIAQAIDRAVSSLAGSTPPEKRSTSAQREGVAISAFGYLAARPRGAKETSVMPLRHTAVNAEVVGVLSSVTVTQTYENPYDEPIEATYVFPLPHRAAVFAMRMRIGTRTIEAKIKGKSEARKLYEQAKKAGKTAALLQQSRPNVFRQSVANIMPGESIHVVLRYVEELIPRDGRYSFVFPMVVGPRYVGASNSGKAAINGPLLARGTRPGHDISLKLTIDAGLPIRHPRPLTHRVRYLQSAPGQTSLEIPPGERLPNRDFVFSFGLAQKTPRLTVLSEHDGRRGHFLLMVQPKAQMQKSDLAPREYVFVVDISGSMSGRPLARAKAIIRRCFASLNADDRFQVIVFAGGAASLASQPLKPTAENLARAKRFLEDASGGGGTEFLPALKLALGAPRHPKRSRIVVFVSDGYISNEAEILRYIAENLGTTNLFAFGVGSSVNRFLIDTMARLGHGRPFVALDHQRSSSIVERLFSLISRPAMTNISVDFSGLAVEQMSPRRPPDLFGDRPLVFVGRYTKASSAQIAVRGYLAAKQISLPFTLNLTGPKVGKKGSPSSPLGYLWARRRIGELMDRYTIAKASDRDAIAAQVKAIALDYSLMSKFTSFVAIDQRRRAKTGARRAFNVPAALPAGLAASAALSTDQFIPGDPEVRITAPTGSRKVTLIFPTGQVKACVHDPRSGQWVASFLIPEDTPDGIYRIRVLITTSDGRQALRHVSYQVDGEAPIAIVTLPNEVVAGQEIAYSVVAATIGSAPTAIAASGDIGDPTFSARVSQEIASVELRLPGGEEITAEGRRDGSFGGTFRAPKRPGRYRVTFVARDAARNKTRLYRWFVVR